MFTPLVHVGEMWHAVHTGLSVLIERVATPKICFDWLLHNKSSTSSLISVGNGLYYDIKNDPFVGYAHSAYKYPVSAQNVPSFAHARNIMCVPNNGIIMM